MTSKTDHDAVTALNTFTAIENVDLKRLNELAASFNIFSAINAIKKETIHSDFLAWLLNPGENHGLGNLFLQAFMDTIAVRAAGRGDRLQEEPSGWCWEDWEVLREDINVDILLRSESNHYLCAIENKIYSGEHDQQLERYAEGIKKCHPQKKRPHWKCRFVYLTIWGQAPSYSEYMSLTYYEVMVLTDSLLSEVGAGLDPDVRTLITHYTEAVRRYLVQDSEVQRLCRAIYKEHKTALDLIFIYGQVILLDIQEIILKLVTSCNRPALITDYVDSSCVGFLPKKLDFIPRSTFPDTDNRMLYFEFSISNRGVDLELWISKGDPEFRKQLYNTVCRRTRLFNRGGHKLNAADNWFSIYSSKQWVTAAQIKTGDMEKIKYELEERFEEFRKGDLVKITDYIHERFKKREC